MEELLIPIYEYYDSRWLKEHTWGGATNTIEKIIEEHKTEELWQLINEVFGEDTPIESTKLNDFLWFDDDFIYESLGIKVEED